MAELFASHGATVVRAASGDEAWALFGRDRPSESARAVLMEGFRAFIAKPADIVELIETIGEFAQRGAATWPPAVSETLGIACTFTNELPDEAC